ncbi:hypothetical protein AC1031_019412 [Aphanomyces cochlioides]|nr:hypothetical protein AC1031_019412 [Aphanomyces cochlioides]
MLTIQGASYHAFNAPNDGNCLYHSLMFFDEVPFNSTDQFREALCEFVNSEDGSLFAQDLLRRFSINASASRKSLVRSVGTDGTWAGDLEMCLISKFLGVRISSVSLVKNRAGDDGSIVFTFNTFDELKSMGHAIPETSPSTELNHFASLAKHPEDLSMHPALEPRLPLWCTKPMTTDEVRDGKKQLSLSDFKWCKKPQTTVKKRTPVKQRASKAKASVKTSHSDKRSPALKNAIMLSYIRKMTTPSHVIDEYKIESPSTEEQDVLPLNSEIPALKKVRGIDLKSNKREQTWCGRAIIIAFHLHHELANRNFTKPLQVFGDLAKKGMSEHVGIDAITI